MLAPAWLPRRLGWFLLTAIGVAGAFSAAALAPSAASAGCGLPPSISFHDQVTGHRINIDTIARTVSFVTSDGRTLYGTNIRMRSVGSRLTASFSAPDRTIILRSELSRGQAEAVAVVRHLAPRPTPLPEGVSAGPQPRLRRPKVDPNRTTYRLSVPRSTRYEVDCRPRSERYKPTATRTPPSRPSPTPTRVPLLPSPTATHSRAEVISLNLDARGGGGGLIVTVYSAVRTNIGDRSTLWLLLRFTNVGTQPIRVSPARLGLKVDPAPAGVVKVSPGPQSALADVLLAPAGSEGAAHSVEAGALFEISRQGTPQEIQYQIEGAPNPIVVRLPSELAAPKR